MTKQIKRYRMQAVCHGSHDGDYDTEVDCEQDDSGKWVRYEDIKHLLGAEMTTEGYKNRPDLVPQVGDIVKWECGGESGEAVVSSIGPPSETFINCMLQGLLHLNKPSKMEFIRRPERTT